MADKSTGAKRIGRDTVRGMGLDPDVDYTLMAKKKLSDFASDEGVGLRNYGRLYQRGLGIEPSTPFEDAGKVREARDEMQRETRGMKKGGKVKSASARADGCCIRGKTRA